MLIITRSLSTYDFGVFQNIGDVLPYLLLFTTLIPEWATRYTARGIKDAARTSLIFNLLLSIPFLIIGFFLTPLFASIAGSRTIFFILAVIQIPIFYLKSSLEGTAGAKAPYLQGYNLIVHEVSNVTLGIFLVFFLKMGLIGVIVTLIGSNAIDVIFYTIWLIDELRPKINLSYLKSWLKISSSTIYKMIGMRLAGFDMILLIMLGGAVSRALFGVASILGGLVWYASVLQSALYPKLLSGGDKKDVEVSVKLMMLFAVPMCIGTITLSKSLLYILNPEYAEAYPIVYVLAVSALIACFISTLDIIILGTEKLDEKLKFKMKDLISSKFFILPSFSYLQAVIVIPVTYFLLKEVARTDLESAFYLSLIQFSVILIIFVFKFKLSRKCMKFELPSRSILKYFLASLLMAAFLSVFKQPPRIIPTFSIVFIGIALYFGVLILIDKEVRALIKAIYAVVSKMLGVKLSVLRI